jgi:hypothetical protein
VTSPLTSWAESGDLKIKRANQHIADLERDIAAWSDRRPYVVASEPEYDPDLGLTRRYGLSYPIQEREPVNEMWAAVVADAVHNLHVSLDHLWQRVYTSGRPRRHNHFPIFANPDEAKPFLQRKERGSPHPAVKLLDRLNVYRTGNPFAVIRNFDDTDKHESLTLLACYPGTVTFDWITPAAERPDRIEWRYIPGPRGMAMQEKTGLHVGMLEDGAILYGSGKPTDDFTNVKVNVAVTPAITFGIGGPYQFRAVVPTLKGLSTLVESLADAFVSEGLLK